MATGQGRAENRPVCFPRPGQQAPCLLRLQIQGGVRPPAETGGIDLNLSAAQQPHQRRTDHFQRRCRLVRNPDQAVYKRALYNGDSFLKPIAAPAPAPDGPGGEQSCQPGVAQ